MLVTDHIYLVTHSQVFLMPFYHKTEGQPSNSLHVQTLADVPSAPPGNVRADVLNATAVELKWSPPPPQVTELKFKLIFDLIDIIQRTLLGLRGH